MNIFYQVIAYFYDLIGVIYFRNNNSPRKAVLDAISERDTILDICTGTGTNAVNIAKTKTSAQIIGVDISKAMLKVAKEKARKSTIKNIKWYQMDASNLKFKKKLFDKVLLSLVLHEMNEELAAQIITEAKRVLKPNGEILITEWETSNSMWKRILFLPLQMLEPKSYHTFIKKDLYIYFRKYDLDIIEIKHCDYSKVIVLKQKNNI